MTDVAPAGPVLLVGAGYVGTELARLLVDAGREVLGVRRSDRPLPAGVQSFRADVVSGEGLDALPREVGQIVYAVSPGGRSADAYRAAYGDGVARVRARFPTARVLLVSSSAVYGAAEGDPLRETDEARPEDETSRELLRAERWLASWPAACVIVRASGIYGPGRVSLLRRLLGEDLDESEARLVTNRIHRDDLARCLHFLLGRPDLGGTVNATDCQPSSLGEMQAWVRAQPLPRATLDRWQQAPLTSRQRRSRSRRLSSDKLVSWGFRFSFPSYREGYRELLSRGPGQAAPP